MPTDAPDFTVARDHVLKEVVRFERRLGAAGVALPANAALPATEALVEVGLDDRDRVEAAMRATFLSGPRDAEAFEEEFPEFWYRLRTGLEATAAHDDTGERAEDLNEDDRPSMDASGLIPDTDSHDDATVTETLEGNGDRFESELPVESRRVADTEVDVTEDTPLAADERPGTYSPAGERTAVGDEETTGSRTVDPVAMRRFEAALATLSGRRWAASPSGRSVDARRALRESMATGGVTMSLPTRERDRTAFSACVLVDVSRSVLDAVDRRFLLSMLDALVADGRSVRVFFFDTAIREVTDTFARYRGDPAAALERAEVAWGGGTKIGASVETLRRRWPDAVDRRTVTLVISDGLEVGDVDDLETGASWLAGRSRAVLWLNPLATSVAWEPTCRGMDAALPYVDGLFAFGGNDDIEDVARQLSRRGPHGAVGYEHDFRDRIPGEGPVVDGDREDASG